MKIALAQIDTTVGALAKNADLVIETLGKALIGVVKSEEPRIEAMEIVFVTTSKEAVQGLANLAAQIRKISKDIVKENWKIRGYDIECASDCSSCGEKQVCDDIRDVISIKKRKEKEN